MRTHFAEVLAQERAALAGVTDASTLADWRRRVVRELMSAQSPYALALRQTGDVPGRADFVARWRRLITETVDRLLQPDGTEDAPCAPECSATQARSADVDAHETAVLILAALHGGCTLSQVAQDPRPLDAALDLALARLSASVGSGLDDGGTG